MALQDVSANLTYPMEQNFDGDVFGLTIEKFDSRVHETMQKKSLLESVFPFKPLIGTDTMSNNIMGNPTLQPVVPGVETPAIKIEVGKNIVQVKTPIIARVTEPMLHAVQSHLDLKSRTPANFGKRIAKSIDEVLFVQIVKSALFDSSSGTGGTGNILPKGEKKTLLAAGDELDPAKLTSLIYDLSQALAEGEIEMEDGFMYMAPAQYFALLKNQDLLNRDFNDMNGSYKDAKIEAVSGMPIVVTNRIQQIADTVASPAFVDSPAALYGAAYETSVAEALCVALFATPESIQVAQSIPLTTKVYWDDRLLTWFIDAFLAIGAGPDRTDVNGSIFKTA